MRKLVIASTAIAVIITIAWFAFAPPRFFQEVSYIIRNAALGSAYVASELCYGVLLQNRSEEDVRAHELGSFIDDRLSWYRANIDHEKGEVRSSMFGFFRQQWGQRSDGSCSGRIPGEGAGPFFMHDEDLRAWPEGDGIYPSFKDLVPDYDKLAAAVEEEFAPFPSGRDRGTRSILIIHNGRLVHERHADGWSRLIPQNGHSNTKAVNAILAGILSAKGKLSLEDDGLRDEWTDERSAIQFRHLLHMESGLDWQEVSGVDDSGYAKLMSYSAADYAAAKPFCHPPGTHYNYSGGDSELAMSVLHQRSGLDEEAWLQFPYDALFGPLGMKRTLLDRDTSGQFVGQGSMYAAATDWARLGLFLARDGVWNDQRILPEGWVNFMATPTENSGCNYATQLWIRGGCTEGQPSPVFEFSGFMGQGVVIIPESETVLVRLGFGPWNMGDLLERVFPALGIEAPTRMAMEAS